MDRFQTAMIEEGIPHDKVHLITRSPIWINRFKNFTKAEVDSMIYLFPKIYNTLYVPCTGLKQATEAEFREAKKKYVPMDLS